MNKINVPNLNRKTRIERLVTACGFVATRVLDTIGSHGGGKVPSTFSKTVFTADGTPGNLFGEILSKARMLPHLGTVPSMNSLLSLSEALAVEPGDVPVEITTALNGIEQAVNSTTRYPQRMKAVAEAIENLAKALKNTRINTHRQGRSAAVYVAGLRPVQKVSQTALLARKRAGVELSKTKGVTTGTPADVRRQRTTQQPQFATA